MPFPKLNFRPEKIVPSDCVPGAGLVSPLWDSISGLAQDLASLPDDDAKGTVQGPGVAALQALSQVHRQQWQVADAQDALLRAPMAKSVIERSQNEASGRLPTSGWGAPQDLWAADADERARVLQSFQRDAADAAVAGRSDKIAKAGATCVDALAAFSDAIDEATSDFDAPSALQGDVKIEDLHRQAQCEQELLSWADQCMPRGLLALEQAIKHNKSDRLKNLVPALTRAANQILQNPPAKRSSRRMGPHEDGPDAAAQRVLRAIRDWRESQRPESIAIATNAIRRMRPIFAALCGRDAPQFMTFDDILRRAQGGDAAHVGPPWELDTSWPYRYAPPSPVRLPGWSRVLMRTEGRLPVREPAPAPLVRAEVRGMQGGVQ
jgi:hypothetical protein